MTLRGGFKDYVINDAALVYLHEQDASPALIDLMMLDEGKVFADEDAWTDHLIAAGITAAKAVRLASEAAVAGSLDHHGLLKDAVIVSDGAGQFNVFLHALCRVGGDVAAPTPQSGRIEARTGLRMMPTSPRSPLSFRTAGFPSVRLEGWHFRRRLPVSLPA